MPGPASRTVAKGRFFGLPVVGREVVFIIDTSGSMKDFMRSGAHRSRLAAAKEQLLFAVQGMDKNSRYKLLTFASDVTVWTPKTVRVRRNTQRTLVEVLDRIRPDGGTNLFAAIHHVLNEAKLKFGESARNRVDEVFVLSDGLPTGEVDDPEKILGIVHDMNRYQKVRIHTIFVGPNSSAGFMRRLAEANGGTFVLVQ